MLSSLERTHFYFQCLITADSSKTKTTFTDSRMRSCSNEFLFYKRSSSHLRAYHPFDKERQKWTQMSGTKTIRDGGYRCHCNLCSSVWCLADFTCLCPNHSFITSLSPKPSVHTCLLIFQSVICLLNAFLRCQRHNKAERQHRFWCTLRKEWAERGKRTLPLLHSEE